MVIASGIEPSEASRSFRTPHPSTAADANGRGRGGWNSRRQRMLWRLEVSNLCRLDLYDVGLPVDAFGLLPCSKKNVGLHG